MIYTRLLFAAILGVMLLTCLGHAQEEDITTATSSMRGVLSTLKQNVEKLKLDNNQWVARDKYIKQQVLQLQTQLGALEAQGGVLNKEASKLQRKNPRLAQQITRLEKENSDLDNRIKNAESGVKLIQRSLDEGYQEDQELLLELKSMNNALPAPPQGQSPESRAVARGQKEKLILMKMIYDSQQRQELLHEAILDFQKNTPLLPTAGALARQKFLKEQIKKLEAQTAAYPPVGLFANLGLANQWDDILLRQLELELKALERNYLQLKDLIEEMSKRTQSPRMTVGQHIEGWKLQNSMADLNRQGAQLRVQLDNLRTQMVDLDKRKSHLEMMIQQ